MDGQIKEIPFARTLPSVHMHPSVLKAASYLDYIFRVAQVVLIFYVVIACPLDYDLTSNVCKALFLYRYTIVRPTIWICWCLAASAAKIVIGIYQRSSLWLFDRLRYIYKAVSSHPGYHQRA